VQFNNSLQSFLVVNQAGATPSNLTIVVGATLLGQAVTSFAATIPGVAGVYMIGPFHSADNLPGTGNVAIDFSSATGITVGAVSLASVY
jgi:hypothetical protein